MRTFALLGVGMMACAHTQPEAGSAAKLRFDADVPLLDCEGTPCIDADLGRGAPVRLLIDTGNLHSALDTKVASAAHLTLERPEAMHLPPGMARAMVPAVRIGATTLTAVDFITMDLQSFVAQHQAPAADGVLTYAAFKDRVLQLDFPAHRLRISAPLRAPARCAGPCDKLSLVTFGKKGPPIVVAQGFAVDGRPVAAQIDTQFTGGLLVYSSAIEKLGLAEVAKTTQVRRFPFTDGGVDMKAAPAGRETFHDLALGGPAAEVLFPTEGVHEPDGLFDATVGLDLLRGTVVTLDLFDLTITLEKPA